MRYAPWATLPRPGEDELAKPLTAPEKTPTEVLKLSTAKEAEEVARLAACAGRPTHQAPKPRTAASAKTGRAQGHQRVEQGDVSAAEGLLTRSEAGASLGFMMRTVSRGVDVAMDGATPW